MRIPFFSKLTHGETVLLVDVGSGSAAVAVAEVHGDRPVKIIASHRAELSLERRSQDQLMSGVIEKTKEAAELTLKQITEVGRAQRIDKAHVCFHPPWTRSRTTFLSASLKKEMKIVDDMVLQLAQKALTAETQLTKSSVFEKRVVHVSLNGYRTTKSIGKRAQDIGVGVLQSEVHVPLYKGVANSLAKVFPDADIKAHSYAFIDSYIISRSPRMKNSHYTIADVTSEATGFTTLHDGIVTAHDTVPFGTRSLLRTLAGKNETADTEIFSRVRMSKKGECSDNECKKVEETLAAAEPTATEDFGKIFAHMAEVHRLPNTLILRAHPDVSGWFVKFLSRLDFSQFTETTQPFTVQKMTVSGLSDHCIFAPGIRGDVALAASATFVHLAQDDRIVTILQ